MALAPTSFLRGWSGFGELARGGLLFIVFFILIDWLDIRRNVSLKLDTGSLVEFLVLMSGTFFYYGSVILLSPITTTLVSYGFDIGVGRDTWSSWLLAWDHVAYAIYLAGCVSIFIGKNNLSKIPVPFVYSIGMSVILLLDAFFPYGSLGPMQMWVQVMVPIVTWVLHLLGADVIGYGNVLRIVGQNGTFTLQIFWPSAGVHSMLIYSIVVIVLMLKLPAPVKRKAIYASFGAIGTAFVNVFRISLIGVYAYLYAHTLQDLITFHDVIGEVLFLIWIIVFVSLVVELETRLIAKRKVIITGIRGSSPLRPGPQ